MSTSTAEQRFTSTAGPRQTKDFQKAASALLGLANACVELWGIRPDSEPDDCPDDQKAGKRSVVSSFVLGAGPEEDKNPRARELYAEIGERYGWTLTRENCREIIDAIRDAIPKARAAMPLIDKRRTESEAREQTEARKREAEEYAEQQRKIEANHAAILAKKPANACALIVAEEEIDDCDSMTDYFNTKTGRRVAIGWRTGSREDFRQLRKAAATFEPTAHLGPDCDIWRVSPVLIRENGERAYDTERTLAADFWGLDWREKYATEAEAREAIDAHPMPEIFTLDGETFRPEWRVESESVEHRDNYSRGAGNYLKASGPYSTGWAVRSRPIERLGGYTFEDALPDPDASEPEGRLSGPGYSVQQHYHTERKTYFYLVVLADRVDRPTFEALRDSAKQAGGWYSRKWGSTPGGFAFGSATEAGTWAAGALGTPSLPPDDDGPQGGSTPTSRPEPKPLGDTRAAAFDRKAESLARSAEAGERDRLENTPKRQRQAATARFEASNDRHGIRACEALAAAWRAGTVPESLRAVKPSEVRSMMRKARDGSRESYYTVCPTDEYADESATARALQAFTDAASAQPTTTADDLRRKSERVEVLRAGIAGFFPTPRHIAERMVRESGIGPGARVLEPSAGRGDLADAIAEAAGPGGIECIEINPRLRALLAESYCVIGQWDFLSIDPDEWGTRYDAVVMNPPFENRQDEAHIRHAWRFVKSGGSLVALCSAGALQNQRSAGFRDWLDEIGAEYGETVEGFETTNVRAGLIVARKDE